MRFFPALLAVGLLFPGVFSSCKKKPQVAAAAAEASPTPTPPPTPEPIDLNSEVVVLCYHRFEDKPKDSLAIKPSEFETHLQVLKDNGITVIPMADFLAWRRGEKSIPPKSAIISIDDGYISGYSVAWPILKKFGYPFTMFIYTDYVKGGPKSGGQSISWQQLAEMRDAGVDIQSHTVSHSALNARKGKNDEQYAAWLKNELAGSKQILEQNLGIPVKAIAYPYGLHNEVVREAVKQAGYEIAFTVYGQRIGNAAEATMIGRYAIESNKPKVFEQAASFTGSVEGGGQGAVMPAAVTMVTQPMEGETVTDPNPEIKANIAAFGDVDPKSVTMRISGVGLVPANYDPNSKLVSYKVTQKLYPGQVTVIVGATVKGRKAEARWSFNLAPKEAVQAGT